MSADEIIDKYYPIGTELRHILISHSQDVAAKALSIASRHPEWALDLPFLKQAAMLHDIGIYLCDAPGIQCFGTEPYIRHGLLGAQLLRKEGQPRHARVCERHTGTGLSLQDIQEQHLPLPPQDFRPETMEEQIICYADKFFSKTHLGEERTIAQARQKLEKFGQRTLTQFDIWAERF